jgi:hypothetical protein
VGFQLWKGLSGCEASKLSQRLTRKHYTKAQADNQRGWMNWRMRLITQERGTDVECKGGFRVVPELALKFRPRISAKQVA